MVYSLCTHVKGRTTPCKLATILVDKFKIHASLTQFCNKAQVSWEET